MLAVGSGTRATGASGAWKKRYQQVVADSKWIRQGLVREVCRGRRWVGWSGAGGGRAHARWPLSFCWNCEKQEVNANSIECSFLDRQLISLMKGYIIKQLSSDKPLSDCWFALITCSPFQTLCRSFISNCSSTSLYQHCKIEINTCFTFQRFNL